MLRLFDLGHIGGVREEDSNLGEVRRKSLRKSVYIPRLHGLDGEKLYQRQILGCLP